jgi:hypothetical protein
MVQTGAVEPSAAIEHDPEKWVPVLRKDHAQSKKIERDDDSKKSHPAWRKETLDGSAQDAIMIYRDEIWSRRCWIM